MNTVNTDLELRIAYWLCNNTELSVKQVQSLCRSVHEFKIILMHRRDCNLDIEPINPIEAGIFTEQEINPSFATGSKQKNFKKQFQVTIKRYVPKSLRQYIPGVIVWLHKTYPRLSDKDIANALGTSPKYVKDAKAALTAQPVNPISVQILNEASLNELLEG
jgi:hypothetical protein